MITTGLELAQSLLRQDVYEPAKRKLIHCLDPMLPEEELRITLQELHKDPRQYRSIAAVIDASKNQKLAEEELFSMNAHSPSLVAGLRWLYSDDNQGFSSEKFVRETLPQLTYVCQLRILSRIAKWITNTELGDKLWKIVRKRSQSLANMLLGACSDDILLDELPHVPTQLRYKTVLLILKKRYESGLSVIEKMFDPDTFLMFYFNSKALRLMLRKDLKKTIDFVGKYQKQSNVLPRMGRKMTKNYAERANKDPSWNDDMYYLDSLHLRALKKFASPENYKTYFLKKCSTEYEDEATIRRWLKHLSHPQRVEHVKEYFRKRHGCDVIEKPLCFSYDLLDHLDQETVDFVVKAAIEDCNEKRQSTVRWDAWISDDQASFTKLKSYLKGESNEQMRIKIYQNIIRNGYLLKDQQAIEKRVKFLCGRVVNEPLAVAKFTEQFGKLLNKSGAFTVTEECWSQLKDMIDHQEHLTEVVSTSFLINVFKRTDLNQTAQLTEIVEYCDKLMTGPSDTNKLFELSMDWRKAFLVEFMKQRENRNYANILLKEGGDNIDCYFRQLLPFKDIVKPLLPSFPYTLRAMKFYISAWYDSVTPRAHVRVELFKMIRHLLMFEIIYSWAIQRDIRNEELERQAKLRWEAFGKSKEFPAKCDLDFGRPYEVERYASILKRALLHSDKVFAQVEKSNEHHKLAELDQIINELSDSPKRASKISNLYVQHKDGKQDHESFMELKEELVRFESCCNSRLVIETVLPLMHGNYLKLTIRAFDKHTRRIPPKQLDEFLRDDIKCFESALSQRKIKLGAYIRNTLFYNMEDIGSVIDSVSVVKEHDELKEYVVKLLYKLVADFGEEEYGPRFRKIVSVLRETDRSTFNFIYQHDDIDHAIPKNFIFVMEKMLELQDRITNLEDSASPSKLFRRISENIYHVPLGSLYELTNNLKKYMKAGHFDMIISYLIIRCLPDQKYELLKNLPPKTDDDFVVWMDESISFDIIQLVLTERKPNSLAVVDFVRDFLLSQPERFFRQIELLDLTTKVLEVPPSEGQDVSSYKVPLNVFLLLALKFAEERLELLGEAFIPIYARVIIHGLECLLDLPRGIRWLEHSLEQIDADSILGQTTELQQLIFLEILHKIGAFFALQKERKAELRKTFLASDSRRVRLFYTYLENI